MYVWITKMVKINIMIVQPIPLGVTFSKAQRSKIEGLFCHVSVKRDVRALNFELWNSTRTCHPKWNLLYFDDWQWIQKCKPIPLGVTFSNAVSSLKFKARTSLFTENVAKEMFELWALSFRKWHPKWYWLYFYQFYGLNFFVNSKIYCVLKCLCVVKSWLKRWMLDDVCKSVVFCVDIIWVIARARLLPHGLCPSFQVDWQ